MRHRARAPAYSTVLPSPTRHDGQYIPEPRLRRPDVRSRRSPGRHVLGYWRCQYPVDTDMISQLGYRAVQDTPTRSHNSCITRARQIRRDFIPRCCCGRARPPPGALAPRRSVVGVGAARDRVCRGTRSATRAPFDACQTRPGRAARRSARNRARRPPLSPSSLATRRAGASS